MNLVESIKQQGKGVAKGICNSLLSEETRVDMGLDDLSGLLLDNAKLFSDSVRLTEGLKSISGTRSDKILIELILETMFEHAGDTITREGLLRTVVKREKEICSLARKKESLGRHSSDSVEAYRAVAETALADSETSEKEYLLLDTLRKSLKLSRSDVWVIEARAKQFPREDNEIHSPEEIDKVVNRLRTLGILFEVKLNGKRVLTIPEEVRLSLRDVISFELPQEAQRNLYNKLSSAQLGSILSAFNFKKSGSKQDKINLLVESKTKPSEALSVLDKAEVHSLRQSIENVRSRDRKEDKITGLVNYCYSLPITD